MQIAWTGLGLDPDLLVEKRLDNSYAQATSLTRSLLNKEGSTDPAGGDGAAVAAPGLGAAAASPADDRPRRRRRVRRP